jgi:hypothetical protein
LRGGEIHFCDLSLLLQKLGSLKILVRASPRIKVYKEDKIKGTA